MTFHVCGLLWPEIYLEKYMYASLLSKKYVINSLNAAFSCWSCLSCFIIFLVKSYNNCKRTHIIMTHTQCRLTCNHRKTKNHESINYLTFIYKRYRKNDIYRWHTLFYKLIYFVQASECTILSLLSLNELNFWTLCCWNRNRTW
jgi:hypothetical protein